MFFAKRLIAVLLSAALLLSACGQADPIPTPMPEPPAPPASSASEPKPSKPEPEASQEPAPPPESVSPASISLPPASEAPASAEPWWKAGLARENFVSDHCGNMMSATYYDNVNKLSYDANNAFSQSSVKEEDQYYNFSLITDNAREVADIGVSLPGGPFFELVALDDTKYVGTLYEKGIALTRALPNKDKGEPVLLELAEADYKQLQDNLAAMSLTENNRWANAAWLTMMRWSRCVSATLTSADGQSTKTYEGNPDNPDEYLNFNILLDLQEISVKPYCEMVPADTKLPGALTAKVDFSHGVSFTIQLTETELIVASSDLTQAAKYQVLRDSSFRSLNHWAAGQANPRTGKPVIYLYPEQPTDCKVTVDYPFAYTYPTYNGGWNVTAYPDGRLVNQADNSEHYYLFWEGNKRIDWTFDSGFVVPGRDTQQFLLEKLPLLGLNAREYNDFITYWVPRMQDNPYNLITFAGEQYERFAPLTVTPTPDSILRVHMVYRPLTAPMEIPEQQIKPFQRKGFTVVEWGGTEAD